MERGRVLNTRSTHKGDEQGAKHKIYYQSRGAGCCIQDLFTMERDRVLNTRPIYKEEGQDAVYKICLQWRGAGC
jgi:hypothetical protein